jgi:1-acyl-sn-glycerol-3-phosphate acyltransferase
MIPSLRMFFAGVFLVIAIPLGALIAFPWTLITGRIGLLYWTGMALCRICVRIAGPRVEVRGLDKIDPAGTYIFMSNHVSNLDPPILMPVVPRRTSVLVKKELWRIPILARALDLASLVPVDRNNRAAAIESIGRAGEVMRQGINMMVYPEGTRSKDGRVGEFKRGPFYLAMDTGFPIVPVTMLGTFAMMPKGQFAAKGGTARVVFHPPINPGKFSSMEELMEVTRDAMRSALPEERR